MNLREVARLRLRNQRVSGARLQSAEEVVAWLGCVQSQEYAYAKWSLAQRASGVVSAAVDEALAEGRILRTHILRPTWHFVLPSDIGWMMSLTAPRVEKFLLRPNAGSVADESLLERGVEGIRAALDGGRRLSRPQLVAELRQRGIEADPIQMNRILIRGELDLVMASGGLVGKAQTYALLDPSLAASAAQAFDRDWALRELTRRFFTSHGPATIPDFTWWSSLTVADTRRGIQLNSASLERVDVAGTDHWWAGDVGGDGLDAGAGEPSPTVHLMQGYDEYIVAHRSPRDPINVDRLVPPGGLSRPPFLHAVILDTQLVGWWRRVPLNDGYRIETQLAREFSARELAALGEEVARYAEFAGVPVSLA